MSTVGFLMDENLSPEIATQLQRHAPEIPLYAVGEVSAPPYGTPDPEILQWIEANNCWLVTNNRKSMPHHLSSHLDAGRHIPGILLTPRPLDIGALITELILIWYASLPDEYRDRIVYLPLA